MRQPAQIQEVLCDAAWNVSVVRGLVPNSEVESGSDGKSPGVDKLWVRVGIGEVFGRLALQGGWQHGTSAPDGASRQLQPSPTLLCSL